MAPGCGYPEALWRRMLLHTCKAFSSLRDPEETHSLEDWGSHTAPPSLLPAGVKVEIKGVTTSLGIWDAEQGAGAEV